MPIADAIALAKAEIDTASPLKESASTPESTTELETVTSNPEVDHVTAGRTAVLTVASARTEPAGAFEDSAEFNLPEVRALISAALASVA